MKETVQERIERVANDNDWQVDFSDRYKEPCNKDVEFSTALPYGPEIDVSVIINDNDPWTLIEDLNSYYSGYDPDYEAYLWIGDDGHGKNGAPYHIKTIVENYERAEEKIGDLLEALRKEFFDYPEEDDEELDEEE